MKRIETYSKNVDRIGRLYTYLYKVLNVQDNERDAFHDAIERISHDSTAMSLQDDNAFIEHFAELFRLSRQRQTDKSRKRREYTLTDFIERRNAIYKED
ncbi:MAG: hypothetical protein LBB27_03000 [Tannerellaceae bacterium]|jgi:hypothetical protein|nr:hypothetical protein [Tannerellaceae bacterium]